MFWLLGIGVGSVAYGLKGERVPGTVITIIGNETDNGLRVAERALWIASGVFEIAMGVLQLHARYRAI